MKGIVLVRHAEPESPIPGLSSHWFDTKLSPLGHRQAAAVAKRLKEELTGLPVRIVSSDLSRASQTAEAIAEALGGLPVETTPLLREFNNGLSVGGSEEALMRSAAAAANAPSADALARPQGETWAEFYARVSQGMAEVAKDEDHIVVVVSHYGAMINAVTWWLGIGLNEKNDAKVSFDALLTAITVLRTNRQGKHTIERLNDTSHLREAGLGQPFQFSQEPPKP